MAAIAFDREYNLTGAGEPMKLVAARVTSDFFPVMGVAPQARTAVHRGRGSPRHTAVVAVISDASLARAVRRRSGNRRTRHPVERQPHTVVGVMPADFRFPQGAGGAAPDIWTPIAEPIQLYRGRHYLWVVARLSDGVTVAQAQAEMDAIAGGIEKELPQFSRGHGANVQPLHGEMVSASAARCSCSSRASDSCCSSACCNVANLLLARAASTAAGIAVRMALGAGRLRVARQLLAEGAVLAALGGGGRAARRDVARVARASVRARRHPAAAERPPRRPAVLALRGRRSACCTALVVRTRAARAR